MKSKTFITLLTMSMALLVSCSQNNKTAKNEAPQTCKQRGENMKPEPHRYGGWYCPDNLTGFPAVDIVEWKNTPVVNGRMPTKEETQNGTSLIFVDAQKYPNAKPLNIKLPKLARFYNEYSQREEYIIVIQAVNITNDSIVGFRYLNGGNGSARLSEVQFLSANDIQSIPKSQFVTHIVNIKANQDSIWNILTNPENAKFLQPTFDANNTLKKDWREGTNVNYHCMTTKTATAQSASKLYGNFYIQNDYTDLNYTEKFFLGEDQETHHTELQIVCGPFTYDFEKQESILSAWGEKVKILSEK